MPLRKLRPAWLAVSLSIAASNWQPPISAEACIHKDLKIGAQHWLQMVPFLSLVPFKYHPIHLNVSLCFFFDPKSIVHIDVPQMKCHSTLPSQDNSTSQLQIGSWTSHQSIAIATSDALAPSSKLLVWFAVWQIHQSFVGHSESAQWGVVESYGSSPPSCVLCWHHLGCWQDCLQPFLTALVLLSAIHQWFVVLSHAYPVRQWDCLLCTVHRGVFPDDKHICWLWFLKPSSFVSLFVRYLFQTMPACFWP